MKKIFYILASAIVALGAVACENEGLDNINPENKGNGLTITATVDEATKVAWTGLTPSWEVGKDKLVIEGFDFLYEGENKFTCEADGVYAAVCDGEVKEITAGEFNSSNGLKGSAWAAQSVIEREDTVVELKLTTALLKVTAAADDTVLKSAVFSNEEVALTKGVETYVPIGQGNNSTVTYYVDGIECKSITTNFVAGKVYNLGELVANPIYLIPNSNWKSYSARFAAYFYNDTANTNTWVDMKDGNGDGVYTVLVPEEEYPNVIFVRMDPSITENDWENGSKWSQTGNLNVPSTDDKYCYIVDWGNSVVWKNVSNWTVPTCAKIYLTPGAWWDNDGAIFRVWTWGRSSGSDAWKEPLYKDNNGRYAFEYDGYTNMIFFRSAPGKTEWDGEWGRIQTTYDSEKTDFVLSAYNKGEWNSYDD